MSKSLVTAVRQDAYFYKSRDGRRRVVISQTNYRKVMKVLEQLEKPKT